MTERKWTLTDDAVIVPPSSSGDEQAASGKLAEVMAWTLLTALRVSGSSARMCAACSIAGAWYMT